MLHKPGTSLPLGPSPFLTGAGPLASSDNDAGGRLRDAGLTVKKSGAIVVRPLTDREVVRWRNPLLGLEGAKGKKRQVVSSHYVL